MALWLFKEEPDCYSYACLEAAGEATWDGVKNAQALNNLRRVRKGDRVLYYHTGKEKAVVGEMSILDDPQEPEPGMVTVRVVPLRRLPRPVALSRIKKEAMLADWELVRLPRLSVLPVTKEQWERVQELAAETSVPTSDGVEGNSTC